MTPDQLFSTVNPLAAVSWLLLMTFMLGPAGWLLYVVISRWRYPEVGMERSGAREFR